VTAYYSVVYQRSVLETQRKILAAFDARLQQVQKSLKLGDGTRLDEAEAQANYDKAVADELAAENTLNDARVVFHQLTGLDAQDITDRSLDCVRYADDMNPEQLKRTAAASNLEVLAALQAIKGSEADLVTATANHLPVVTLQAGYGKNWSRAEG
ncbi:TolC family protein, partial [Escherichia coli]|uniref:TolC family protein n=1 Tax=Escherichia coli TaxID=562 RepID=UPI001327ECB9